jgi:hypothetical protein
MKRGGFKIDEKYLDKMVEEGKIRSYLVIDHPLKKPEPQIKKQKKPGRAKYNNEKVEYDGHVFDSKKEYRRYRELLLLQKAFLIVGLRCQQEFRFDVEGQKVASYFADFTYRDVKTGQIVVEDVKSDATRKLPVYRLKKKLMKAIHKIEIKEV